MEQPFIQSILFPIIRAGMGLTAPTIDITAEDLKELKKVGKRQSILPIIYEGLKKCGMSPELDTELERGRLEYIRKYVIRDDCLNKVYQSLNQGHISFIPLKGSILQHLYPEAWLRTSNDIDILVHEEDLETAVATCRQHRNFRHFEHSNFPDWKRHGFPAFWKKVLSKRN